MDRDRLTDGLCSPQIEIEARQLPGTVCRLGGAECPLIDEKTARAVLDAVKSDPTVAIRLTSDADNILHHSRLTSEDYAETDVQDALNRKRDLDVLQRLGLLPGDTRRARYLYDLLFQRIETLNGICAYDTPGWEGCELARSGAYESVRERGFGAVVYLRPQEEKDEYRRRSAKVAAEGDCISVRAHHFMCMACWYNGGEHGGARPEDTIYEIWERIRREPDVSVRIVEGCCDACDCCDGFHPATSRCVHAGGLIRDFKKDLDVLQKLGLRPGAVLPAREFIELMFARIASTVEVCGYGDGVVRSNEWAICSGPEGNKGYERSRETGMLG